MQERLRWPDEEPLFTAPAVGWAGVQAHRCAVNESRSLQFRRLERPLAGDLCRLVSVRLALRRAAYASLGSLGQSAVRFHRLRLFPRCAQHVHYSEERSCCFSLFLAAFDFPDG